MPPMHVLVDDVCNDSLSDISLENRGLHGRQNASLRNNAFSRLAGDFPRVILMKRLRNNPSHMQAAAIAVNCRRLLVVPKVFRVSIGDCPSSRGYDAINPPAGRGYWSWFS